MREARARATHDAGAVVTGAASGIGAAVATALLGAGLRVLMVDVDADALHASVDRLGEAASACAVDLAEDGAVETVVRTVHDAMPDVGVLVNDAGVSSKTPFLEATPEEWERVLGVNVYAAAALSSAFAAEMARRHRGCIVNVSSISGLRGGPPQSVYGISKGALIGLTSELASRLGPDGVRVNAVLPGVIDTPMVRRDVAADGDADGSGLARWIRDAVPLGRIGLAEEVAAVVAFLASARADSITGALVPVEGGYLSA
jgi:NAD(P)-dependent dehydrogenase (short-subunit alcohol dehydrogenase family)